MELDEYLALQKRTRSRPRHEESDEQSHFVMYVRAKHPKLPIIMSPIFKFTGNPIQRAKQGKRMKDMGYTSGTLDLFFPIKSRGYAGIFIELKTNKNTLTPEQKEMIIALTHNGYYAVEARGCKEAIILFDWYIGKE